MIDDIAAAEGGDVPRAASEVGASKVVMSAIVRPVCDTAKLSTSPSAFGFVSPEWQILQMRVVSLIAKGGGRVDQFGGNPARLPVVGTVR